MSLDRWRPEQGCMKEDLGKRVWLRVVDLPLHLRTNINFKSFRRCLWGFLRSRL